MPVPERTNLPATKESEQSVLNKSQDSKYGVLAVELVAEDSTQTSLVRLKTDASGNLATSGLTNTELRATPIPVSGTLNQAFASRSDTFTVTGNGVTVDRSTAPLKYYAVAVKCTGAAATSWDVRLEGSLDNTNFTQILAHTNVTGDGALLWLTSPAVSLYFRTRTAGLVLGTATNIIVTTIGQN